MREASYVLDGVVFDFDSQVSAKFGIPTIDSREFKGSRVGVESSLEAIHIVSEEARKRGVAQESYCGDWR
jgi:hypothetical protein